MSIELTMQRAALSSAAWERARWSDGRRVIVAPLRSDMGMQGPTCRVMPSEPHRKRWPSWEIIGAEPHEEAITMTWEALAVELLKPIVMFGFPKTD